MQYNDVFFHKIYWYSSGILNLLIYNHSTGNEYLTIGLTIQRWFKDYVFHLKSQNEAILMINVWQAANTICSNIGLLFICSDFLNSIFDLQRRYINTWTLQICMFDTYKHNHILHPVCYFYVFYVIKLCNSKSIVFHPVIWGNSSETFTIYHIHWVDI